jgi:apolipoprotein D and lipocalin family protein
MAAALVLLLTACADSGRVAAPEPPWPIDAARFYTGRWYEIARTPMSFVEGCVAGTTDYRRTADGRLVQRDACRQGTPAGPEKVFAGDVTMLNAPRDTKLSVRYMLWGFVPVPKTWWILDHDDAYTWFIVADPAFENVAILTRSPRPPAAEIERLTARVRALGYDPGKLEFPALFPPGQG